MVSGGVIHTTTPVLFLHRTYINKLREIVIYYNNRKRNVEIMVSASNVDSAIKSR